MMTAGQPVVFLLIDKVGLT